MEHKILKIHNEEDFKRITSGIKIAQCMRFEPSISGIEKAIENENIIVSDSLSCNLCNTNFDDRDQQRVHYKLDWHRYNLKRRLLGLKSVSENAFCLIADKDDVSSISGSESDEDEEDVLDTGDSPSGNSKNSDSYSRNIVKNVKKGKPIEYDSTDEEYNDDYLEEKKTNALKVTASRHTKVFFENDDGHIFSIYRCLLHSKRNVPEQNSEMIAQALESGKLRKWIIIMIGGGHFAAAVYFGGEPILHKTFHHYNVRIKQNTSQGARMNGNHQKSANASVRRNNENILIQPVQDILSSWSSHINDSSLILYRAVGPQNRTVLFGGKNPPLYKYDLRLRPLPFPTRRATYKEVSRVYDVISSMEIYGLAVNFTDSFPISPRQPIRKKSSKLSVFNETAINAAPDNESVIATAFNETIENNEKQQNESQTFPEKSFDVSRSDKSERKCRKISHSCSKVFAKYNKILEDIYFDLEEFNSDLEDFNSDLEVLEWLYGIVPKHLKKRKIKQKKKKERKDKVQDFHEKDAMADYKSKFWEACKSGDIKLFDVTLQDLLAKVEKSERMQNTKNREENLSFTPINRVDVIKAVNECNKEGNTMLHVAAEGHHVQVVWNLLSMGSDPNSKNKKLQTPYTITTDERTRNIFKRFMDEYPENVTICV